MEAFRLLLTPTFKEIICSNLTFEEAIQLRDALGFESLKCPIPVIDPIDQKEIILPGVNSTTIATNELIKEHGLNLALIEAVKTGQISVVKTLITAGVDVNATDQTGNPALMVAAINGQNLVVQTLIDNGANVNAVNWFGNTALIFASGNNLAVQTLVDNKADVNIINQNGQSALSYAYMGGYDQTVEILRKAGAQ